MYGWFLEEREERFEMNLSLYCLFRTLAKLTSFTTLTISFLLLLLIFLLGSH